MDPQEKEKLIQEQRTVEATQKELMGLGGKIGTVLRVLGDEIVEQYEGMYHMEMGESGGWGYSRHTLEDISSEEEWDGELRPGTSEEIQDQIPYADSESIGDEPTGDGFRQERTAKRNITRSNVIGWHFDGLQRGVHMEISYMERNKELRVTFRGDRVYSELLGQLISYIPNEAWEKEIDRFFAIAKKKNRDIIRETKDARMQEGEQEKRGWIQRMRDLWGI